RGRGREVGRAVEPEAVAQDRAAESQGRALAVDRVLDRTLAVGHEIRGLVFVAPLTVELVGPRLGDGVDHHAPGPAELGGDAAALDAHLVDVDLGDVGQDVPVVRVGDVDAVEQVGVV